MADLLPRNRVLKIQHRSEETPAKSFLVCVRLRQRSLLLLRGLFTHKSLRDDPLKIKRLHSFFTTVSSKLSNSLPTFSEIIMKSYFCILIALCIVLQTVQAAEMGSRARRQSENLITLHIPKDLLNQLLESMLGQGGIGDILRNILGNGGGN
ncbi:uncharacterized protein TNCV_2398471 [Trichonephila clavipes]|uniref:Uncharacterized protein n=1 Tax=Trichonephila clavipes TaxID=2585209 RepID=A0A8X6VHB2_TRICX|nr:uncharacterized protein TNCV_2398471 [Trichonephila clavipes]